VPKKTQLKQRKKKDYDPEELQLKDETNTKWVEEWKKTIEKKYPPCGLTLCFELRLLLLQL
jgi:hypothetical protein